ncbi:hypothetical protein EDD11_004412 [Mortierella claussenii]|nr:hypothetical protein EDD11_004412 [Mortierella claussenii]
MSESTSISATSTIHSMPEKAWYLRNTIEGVSGSQKYGPLPAVVVRAGPRWKCSLDIGALEPGWYSIVFCVSFKNMDTKSLQSLIIDARQLDDDNHGVYMTKTCKTIISNEELRRIPTERFTRLRLHRQIELDAGGPMELSFSFGSGALGSFEVRYVTLESGQNGVYDHVLYGEGKPQQLINIGQGKDVARHKTLNVHSYAISSSGSHAVTLYFDGGRAFLEVWDLRQSREESLSSTPRIHNTPIARAFIMAFTTSHPDLMDISLSISSFGSQVVLHSAEPSEMGIPCHIFNCDAPAPADHDMSKPWMLSLTTICEGLRGYYGYGAFHFSTNETPYEKDERYLTCDGSSVAVYNILGGWNRLHVLTLSVESNLDAALALFLSIRGRYFAWTGTKGVVSIWDVIAAKQVSFIPLENDYTSVYANMSRDGSMIAISVKGRISIYQTFSGVKLGDYEPGMSDENYFEVVLEKDHFLVLDQPSPDATSSEQIGCRRLISARDMSVAKTLSIHQDYEVQYPVPVASPAFAYAQGSVVNIVKAANALAPPRDTSTSCGHDCLMNVLPVDLFTEDETLEYGYDDSTGALFTITATQSRVHNVRTTFLTINCPDDSSSEKLRTFSLPLGPAQVVYSGVFIPVTSQLVLSTGRYMQIWRLSAVPGTEIAELEMVWKLKDEGREHAIDICHRKIASASACSHGKHLALDLYPARWFRKSRELPRLEKRNAIETVTYPIFSMDNMGTTEAFRVNHGVLGLVDLYSFGDEDCQAAVLRHLKTLVRPSTKTRTSVVTTLCRFWTPEKKVYFEEMMAGLLSSHEITWIPESQESNNIDPLAVILKAAESQPSAIGLAKIIMDYCTIHANQSINLSFMSPIFASWRKVMAQAPAEALKSMDRMAYIPVQQRSYIINNHAVVHSARPRWTFWKTNSQPLWKTVDPILQLQVSPKKSDPMNEQFAQPVFVASFDALWQYKEVPSKDVNDQITRSVSGASSLWWQTMFYSIWLKLRLTNQAYVECKDSSLEYFDNPAISALVDYKWNTIGYKYWMLRFFFQCCYYILITTVAIMQVYFPNFRLLKDAFIAIVALSAMFLWLELSRAIRCWTRYNSISTESTFSTESASHTAVATIQPSPLACHPGVSASASALATERPLTTPQANAADIAFKEDSSLSPIAHSDPISIPLPLVSVSSAPLTPPSSHFSPANTSNTSDTKTDDETDAAATLLLGTTSTTTSQSNMPTSSNNNSSSSSSNSVDHGTVTASTPSVKNPFMAGSLLQQRVEAEKQEIENMKQQLKMREQAGILGAVRGTHGTGLPGESASPTHSQQYSSGHGRGVSSSGSSSPLSSNTPGHSPQYIKQQQHQQQQYQHQQQLLQQHQQQMQQLQQDKQSSGPKFGGPGTLIEKGEARAAQLSLERSRSMGTGLLRPTIGSKPAHPRTRSRSKGPPEDRAQLGQSISPHSRSSGPTSPSGGAPGVSQGPLLHFADSDAMIQPGLLLSRAKSAKQPPTGHPSSSSATASSHGNRSPGNQYSGNGGSKGRQVSGGASSQNLLGQGGRSRIKPLVNLGNINTSQDVIGPGLLTNGNPTANSYNTSTQDKLLSAKSPQRRIKPLLEF